MSGLPESPQNSLAYRWEEECSKDYDEITNIGEFEIPGNRHPEYRYRGYKGWILEPGYTEDQKAAWEEGRRAQEGVLI